MRAWLLCINQCQESPSPTAGPEGYSSKLMHVRKHLYSATREVLAGFMANVHSLNVLSSQARTVHRFQSI